MKVWFRCYKCGEAFEAEERVRTDICPHCMSFVDLARAEKLAGRPEADAADSRKPAAPAAPENAAVPAAPAGAASSSAIKDHTKGAPLIQTAGTHVRGISPQRCPAGAEAGDTYESLYDKAEKMMSFGAWSNAAELFGHCLEKKESWLARFGLVRASTRELTDLSNFTAVQKDADAAFDKMTAAERLSLGKRYVPKLDEKRESLSKSYAALDLQGDKPLAKSARKNSKKWAAAIILGFVVMLFLVMLGVILYADRPDEGAFIIILGVALGVLEIVLASIVAVKQKRVAAKLAAAEDITEQTRQAERAKLKAQIDAIDYLCGYLKY